MHRHSLLRAVAAVALVVVAAGCSKRVDLSQGGTRLTLRADATGAADKRDAALRAVVDRFVRAKVPVIATRSGDDLFADVPAGGDLDRVKTLATSRGQLLVKDEASPDGQVLVDRVAGARIERDKQTGRGTLTLTLRPDDAARVGTLSQKLIGKKMVIALDGSPLTRPLVQTAIPGDRLLIPLPAIRDPAIAEVESASLVAMFESGALPVAVSIALEEPISPQKR